MPEVTLQPLLDRRAEFLAFVRRRVANPMQAEDIVQAAYVRALEHEEVLRDGSAATAWFYSILRNAVIDHYRRGATESAAVERYGREEGLIGKSAAEPATASPDERHFACGCIAQVLPKLRPAYAELLREVDLEESSLGEFARRHNISSGNAAVRAHRARAALREELQRFCGACSVDACLDCFCKPQEA
jgi:RNA polymerase sigma-70 factor (ECF subfamily)